MQISRITHNPAVMGGKPCIRDLRVTVGTVLGLLASGQSRERILQAYPYLEPQDLDEAMAYADRQPHSTLQQIMDEIGQEAENRGLTPAILESLLQGFGPQFHA